MKKIIVTGNVGRDAELRADHSGNSFTSFSVGVSVGTKALPKTDWVDVTCNNKLGEIASQYVKKGTKVLIEGFPSVNSYLTKDGKPAASLRIFAQNIEFLTPKPDDADHEDSHLNAEHETLPPLQHTSNTALTTDDIPF